MEFLDLNTTKILSPKNIKWGIWNLEVTDDDYGHFLRDDNLQSYNDINVKFGFVSSIWRYIETHEEFKKDLIKDIFEHFLLWAI